jgi:hypothetical protein
MNIRYLKFQNSYFFSIYSILLIFSISFISSCNKDPLEKEIYTALNEGDYIKAATFCASYKGDSYKDKCLEAKNISEEEITSILSQKKDFPFMKLFIQSEKDEKIRELLKKDIYLGVKYRIIWNEISEKK